MAGLGVSRDDGTLRDYSRAYPDVTLILIDRYGRAHVTRNPNAMHTAVEVAWATADQARAIARHVNAYASSIAEAATDLGITVTAHDRLTERVRAAVAEVDAVLDDAEAAGLLKFFNANDRTARRRARESGKGFMAYQVAVRRLRAAIFRRLADVRRYGVMVPQILQDGLMADVFGPGYLE